MKKVLEFLHLLAENNNKEWFNANKNLYTQANEEFKALIGKIHLELSKYDVLEEPKTFRIYRDVRFSTDKTPYKKNFGGHLPRATQLRRGGYYLHIEPGASFIGGGFWQPEPRDLKRIRDEFVADPHTIQKITSGADFQKYYRNLEGEKLSRPPKGYEAQLPGIELIKHKSFVATKPLTETELLSPDFHLLAADIFKSLLPFHEYMSGVLTTNINGELIV
jgi:uncharacterized protein (TIGR02453 family)